jgi:ATP-binding protein involved in chromosome partitioning
MKSYHDITSDGGSNVVGQITEQVDRLNARLSSVGHCIAIMSGKGGVGKSSVAVNLASILAASEFRVGIMDADLNGASIAKMTGVHGQKLQYGASGILPAVNVEGIKIMSIDLFLPDEKAPVMWDAPTQKDAFTWRAMVEMGAIREFLTDTEWGELDYLLIDLPPGTDKLPNLVDVLPRLSGTLIVTIPSKVSQFVVGKSIQMATDLLETPVIGLIENMYAFVDPVTGHEVPLYPTGHVDRLAETYDVPLLARIPFDPHLAEAGDEGYSYVSRHPASLATKAYNIISEQVQLFVRSSFVERSVDTGGNH